MKFIHLRRYQAPSFPEAEPQLLPHGGATIAYYEEPGAVEGENYLHYFVAKCCNRDMFCKDIGRKIAKGRLEVGQGYFVSIPANKPRHEIRDLLIERYYQGQEGYNPHVRKEVR